MQLYKSEICMDTSKYICSGNIISDVFRSSKLDERIVKMESWMMFQWWNYSEPKLTRSSYKWWILCLVWSLWNV